MTMATVYQQRTEVLDQLRQTVAADLRRLTVLHDRVLTRESLMLLWADCYEDCFGLDLDSTRGRAALTLFRAGLSDIPTDAAQSTMESLAQEHFSIYSDGRLGVSLCESAWADGEVFAIEAPRISIGDWYHRFGLLLEDWYKPSEDHLVSQLSFIAYLLDGAPRAPFEEVARFMDEHLLCWIDDFEKGVRAACKARFYAGLAALTAAYVDELRNLLSELSDYPRPKTQQIEARVVSSCGVAVDSLAPFRFGVGLSGVSAWSDLRSRERI